MSLMLENKQGLIAGDGILPIEMARHAKENGFEVICVSLANDNGGRDNISVIVVKIN